jgi:N-acetylmuramoyl-L-alanine amidase
LVETGFISNQQEREYLNSDSGRKEVATSIYKAVKEYRTYLDGR